MMSRKKSLCLQTFIVVLLAPFCFMGSLTLFAIDVSAADDCGCLTAKHACLCEECEAYSPELCPQNPYCAVGSPIYPGCRGCIKSCDAAFRECLRSCNGGPPEDILCIGVKCKAGYTCVDGSCVSKNNPPPPSDKDDPACTGVKCDRGYKCVQGNCIPK